MANQDTLHEQEERLQELSRFSVKLASSGYTAQNRKEIIVSGLLRYYRIQLQEAAGVRKLYRSADEMRKARILKPLKQKAWYKTRRGGTKVSAAKDFPLGREARQGNGKRYDAGEGKKEEDRQENKPRQLVVETPVFIPYTRESVVKKRLQEIDNLMGEATEYPAVTFVERCGGSTISDLLGRANPWANLWECGRSRCLPCQGRALLAQEQEEREIQRKGEVLLPKPGKDMTTAIPKCTSESVRYAMECWDCRKGGKKFMYIGETSRSAYQRGREHQEEVDLAKKSHPLVIHFQECHQGQQQQLLMRTVKVARTALERQVWESVHIDRLSDQGEACLNLKCE